MDDRQPDAMTDEALDREIRAALSVRPSPGFAARIRTRVAEEDGAPAWRLRPSWLVVASAVSAVAVVLLLWQTTDTVAPVGAPASDPESAPVSVADNDPVANGADVDPTPARAEAVAPAPSPEPRAEARRRGAASAGRRPRLASGSPGASPDAVSAAVAVPREPSMPEVLVSEDERRAIDWLVTQSRGRQVERAITLRQPAAQVKVPEVAIAPLAIEALPQLARLE